MWGDTTAGLLSGLVLDAGLVWNLLTKLEKPLSTAVRELADSRYTGCHTYEHWYWNKEKLHPNTLKSSCCRKKVGHTQSYQNKAEVIDQACHQLFGPLNNYVQPPLSVFLSVYIKIGSVWFIFSLIQSHFTFLHSLSFLCQGHFR